MIPLAKGAVGLLALGAAAGAGFGASYLNSEASKDSKNDENSSNEQQIEKKTLSLPENRKWLSVDDDTDKEEWKKKVLAYGDGKLDGYTKISENGKEDANIEGMKKACKALKEGEFENSVLAGKLKQAEDWCSIKKKVKEMLNDKEYVSLSFEEGNTDSADWEAVFKKKLDDTGNEFSVNGWKSKKGSEGSKLDDIKAMKKECKGFMEKEVDDGKANVSLFEKWCMKKKTTATS